MAKEKKRRPGQPKIGSGSKVVGISVEAGLLKRIDAHIKRGGIRRSAFFCEGARMVLDAADSTGPDDRIVQKIPE